MDERDWNKKWYVLHVKTGEEDTIKRYIERHMKDSRVLCPKRELPEKRNGKWEYVIKTCFTGYVFVEIEMTADNYYRLTGIPKVIRIIGDVPDEEMKLVFVLENSGKPFGLSDLYYEGKEVKVSSGPLSGFEGRIVKVDARRFRAKICIEILDQSKIVEVAVNVLK